MDHVVEIITAACDKKFTDGQIAKFHGKVCVCLSEMIHEVGKCVFINVG